MYSFKTIYRKLYSICPPRTGYSIADQVGRHPFLDSKPDMGMSTVLHINFFDKGVEICADGVPEPLFYGGTEHAHDLWECKEYLTSI
jgi:hypothetical protein